MYSAEYRDLSDSGGSCRVFGITYPTDAHVDIGIGALRRIAMFVDAPEQLLPIADAIYKACGLVEHRMTGNAQVDFEAQP